METTKDIDKGIETLRDELDRGDGKRRLSMQQHRKYLLLIVVLALFMFLFGALTRPNPTQVRVEQVATDLDSQAPVLTKEDYDLRVSLLYKNKGVLEKSVPRTLGSATSPSILTWTPGSVGKEGGSGEALPIVGTYEVPPGWFGAIRLFSDGEEVGVHYVDSRGLQSSATGDFSISPTLLKGQHLIRLSFDAVKACRIACDPADQLCIATNVNYCAPQFDNQSFLTYLPTKAESQPIVGGCTTKTFVVGPKYAPQIPEDYAMCERGMWNSDMSAEVDEWLRGIDVIGVEQKGDIVRLIKDWSDPNTRQGKWILEYAQTQPDRTAKFINMIGDMQVISTYKMGDGEAETACQYAVEFKMSCPSEIPIQPSKPSRPSQADINNVPELTTVIGPVKDFVVHLFTTKTAHAQWSIPLPPPLPPVNGVCGPANNTHYPMGTPQPSNAQLCSSGSVGSLTALTLPETSATRGWSWRCNGSSGGTSATCSARVSQGTQCSDGTDNDGDGLIDARDPGCSSDLDNNEASPVSCLPGGAYSWFLPDGINPTLTPPLGVDANYSWFALMSPGLRPVIESRCCSAEVTYEMAGGGWEQNPGECGSSANPCWLPVPVYPIAAACTAAAPPPPPPPPSSCPSVINIPRHWEASAQTTILNDPTYLSIPMCTAIPGGVPSATNPQCKGPVNGGSPDYFARYSYCSDYTPPSSGCAATTIGNCSLSARGHLGSSGSCVGGYSGSCNFTCTNGAWNQNSNSCVVSIADISVPATLNFGPVPVGGSVERDLVITNVGNIPVIGSISLPSITGGIYTCVSVCGYSVSPASPTATIRIRLSATINDSLNGNANVSGVTPNKSVQLTGTAVTDTALDIVHMGVTPISDPYTVGIGNINSTAATQYFDFAVRNGGSGAMSWNASISGGSAAGYTLIPMNANGCGGGTITNTDPIPRICRVSFDPDSSIVGNRNAQIVFDNTTSGSISGDDPINVNFSANVVSGPITEVFPVAGPDPVTITRPAADIFNVNFGSVNIGSSKTRSIVIANTGNQNLNISSYSALIPPAFSSLGGASVIAPLGNHPISITFSPTASGAQTNIITAQTNDPNFPLGVVTIRVQGVGVASPNLVLTKPNGLTTPMSAGSANYTFPDQDIYSGAITRQFSITNTGSAPATVTLSSPGAPFGVPGGSMNIPANGIPVPFSITFDPSTPVSTSRSTTITATSYPNFVLTLIGTGVDTPPLLSIDQALDFGRVIVGKSKSITTNIRNSDTLIPPRDFGSPNVVAIPGGTFECTDGCTPNPSLPHNVARSITIKFTPSEVMTYNGSLQFSDGGVFTGNWYSIPMVGRGIRPTIQYKEN